MIVKMVEDNIAIPKDNSQYLISQNLDQVLEERDTGTAQSSLPTVLPVVAVMVLVNAPPRDWTFCC